MTNTPDYGHHSTDIVDYRTEYKMLVRDVAQYNQGGLPQGLDGIIQRTNKEKIKHWLDVAAFVLSGEGNQANWQNQGYYERVLPLDVYSVGSMFTDEFIEDASPDEIAQWKADAFRADQRLIAKLFFATTVGGDNSGTQRGFWTGNATDWTGTTLTGFNAAPHNWKRNSWDSTHNHYTTTGASTIALADLTAVKEQITEHGYGLAGNLAMFISQNTSKDIADLAGWTTAMTANPVVDSIAIAGMKTGQNMLGFSFIIDDWMPDDYLYGQATDQKAVGLREPKNGGGLKFFEGPYDKYPFKESYFKHRMGMAVNARGSGTVYHVTSGSYTTQGTTWTFEP